jgi:putative membrane protein
MLELLLFIFLGLILGIVLGLIPGLHPNMIALLVPALAAMNMGTINFIAFVVALAVSNTFLDFIPSMLLGAPEPGKELILLPAHKMLLEGNGYDAVKLAVTGGLGSVIFIVCALPLIVLAVPPVYAFVKPFTYVLLIFITCLIVLSEDGLSKKATATFCFLAAGFIGMLSSQMNIDRTLVLFPILSGLFGVSMLLLAAGEKVNVPKKKKDVFVSSRQTRRATIFGSLGGIFSGLIPGVGSSEVATIASVDKNEKSFLITVGAVTISNTIMAMLAIGLIQKPRSGLAVVLSQLTTIGFGEMLLIAATALLAGGVSTVVTLKLTKKFIGGIGKINYGLVNKTVIAVIFFMTIIFTGFYGLILLATCAALGIFTNLAGVRRSVLMGVLILPTILFYLPF